LNNATKNNKFFKLIFDWYLVNGRDHLPWRKQVTPYRIWIFEIMLQQTQVQTVIPFFERFISKYPQLKIIYQLPLRMRFWHFGLV
jgi:A/G-specific DNA glycosylase